MSASGSLPSGCNTSGGFLAILSCGTGTGLDNQGQTAGSLAAAIVTALISFGIQILLFMVLRLRLSRIYRPRSFLVPEKERVAPPPPGIVGWLKPLFTTSNLNFIQKCGLDAYFFLRYLRMLIKMFVPIAMVVLPILLPINRYSGSNTGLDRLSISNISGKYTTRLWAHLLLAIVVIIWVCYVLYSELRGYIRVRQAFLTSPQHRLRASATTVLVTGIPRKWLTVEALNGLYDVFPGGIRNIWINRNFDELSDKVTYRASVATSLEDAETNLIKMCRKKYDKSEEQRRKREGRAKKTKQEKREDQQAGDADAERVAQANGVSAGDQHDTPHDLNHALNDAEAAEEKRDDHDYHKHAPSNSLGLIGDGFGAIGQGLNNIGKGVGNFGRNLVGDVDAGFQKAGQNVDQGVTKVADLGSGFVMDDDLYRRSQYSQGSVPPTPPPKSPMTPRRKGTFGAQIEGPLSLPSDREATTGQQPYGTSRELPGDTTRTADAQASPSVRMTGPSMESKPKSALQIEVPADHQAPPKKWQFWKKNSDHTIALPSPQPHTAEEDEYPLNNGAARRNGSPTPAEKAAPPVSGSKLFETILFWTKKTPPEEDGKEVYPEAIVQGYDEDQDGEPIWRRYLDPKERETMRLPLFSPSWFPTLPFVGPKVDRIYHLRRELARMNLEIETDQNDVDKFPFMNSAFIQFNHQVAAHMACQTLSHHVPQHMTPRMVEISPDDVLWDNMSIKWWERYLRTVLVLAICAALIVFYAVPVTFTSLLAKISTLEQINGFGWLAKIPKVLISVIQGALPPIILAVILALVPIIFRALVKQQGVATGNSRELGVQQWYFAFLFIQVFLVVTISGGLINIFSSLASHPNQVLSTLGRSLPKASNYFFSYLSVQALSNSASALLQVGSLLGWFVLAPLLDSTARAKWRRETTLSNVEWGSFFPPFTNFAVIGIIYSILAPLILVFMLFIFAMFWVVYRYNVLYVYQFRNDTGGLLFPTAINQLFTGLYMMELCLVGFFFITTDQNNKLVCFPQAIIMIVALICTIAYQFLLNTSFNPLFQYLPITLEDEAVVRDEEFARAQASKFAPLRDGPGTEDDRDIQDVLEEREQKEEDAEDRAEEQEAKKIAEHRRNQRDSSLHSTVGTPRTTNTRPQSWHQVHTQSPKPTWKTDRFKQVGPQAVSRLRRLTASERDEKPATNGHTVNPQTAKTQDVEAQKTVGDVLFSGFADEIEDLTPDERDLLVRYAFQHSALRAKRPVIWIPRDRLGVSDDEIKRAKRMSTIYVDDHEKAGHTEKTNIWISNEGVALNGRGKVVFRRSPPDFSNVDLIAL